MKKGIEYAVVMLFPVLVFLVGFLIYPMDTFETVLASRSVLGEDVGYSNYFDTVLASTSYTGVYSDSGRVINILQVSSDEPDIVKILVEVRGEVLEMYVKVPNSSYIELLHNSNISFVGLKIIAEEGKGREIIIARAIYINKSSDHEVGKSVCIYREKYEKECLEIEKKIQKRYGEERSERSSD
ncbi:MAG: hypothetical protein QXS84_01500 [Sulfolobales archaeon]